MTEVDILVKTGSRSVPLSQKQTNGEGKRKFRKKGGGREERETWGDPFKQARRGTSDFRVRSVD